MSSASRYQEFVDRMVEGLTSAPGELSSWERRAVIDYASRLTVGRSDGPDFLTPDESHLVQLVSLASHEVDDDLIDGLKTSRVPEDRILELVNCAAVGAGVARFELAMEYLT